MGVYMFTNFKNVLFLVIYFHFCVTDILGGKGWMESGDHTQQYSGAIPGSVLRSNFWQYSEEP